MAYDRYQERLVAHRGRVYGVVRVSSTDVLHRTGYASLEGSEAYTQMLDRRRRQREEYLAGLRDDRKTDEEKAKIRADLDAHEANRTREHQEALLNDPDRALAYVNRLGSYVAACVRRVGEFDLEASANAGLALMTPHLYPPGTRWSDVCVDLREEEDEDPHPVYFQRVQFVMTEEEAAPDNGILPIGIFDQTELLELGTVIYTFQGVSGRLADTFRLGSRISALPSQDVEALEDPPLGDPEVEPVGDGA